MLFSNGPKLNLNWLTPALVLFVVAISVVMKCLASLSIEKFAVLLLNLVGTVLLASAFEPHIPKHGDGGWSDSLKFAIKEFPKYGSPPSFDFVRLYIGLLCLIGGTIVGILLP